MKDDGKKVSGIIGGTVLVVAGILLFLNVIGVIRYTVWNGFATFWPIILILIGLAIIFRMRHLTTALVVLLIIIAAMLISNIISANHVIESGNMTTKYYDARNFNDIQLDIPGELHVIQAENYSVRVDADQNVVDLIDADSQNGTLHIRYHDDFWNIWKPNNVKVYITSPDISSIQVTGAGDIKTGNTIKSENLKVIVSGAGNINLDADVQSLEVRISGFGNAHVTGHANQTKYIISGAGNIEGYGLETQFANVTVSGTGNCEVNSTQTLDVSISGAGDVKYLGNPYVRQVISGAGNVKKEE